MRILFVWPNKDQFGFKPTGIALLSAILKQKGHDVDLFDTTFIEFGFRDNTEVRSKYRIFKDVDFSNYDIQKKKLDLEHELIGKLDAFKPDIVGISALSDEVYISFKVSEIVKKWKRSAVVIWGNKAATMSPEKILGCNDVDYLCIGEGVECMPEFVDCVSRGGGPQKIRNIAYRDAAGKVIKNSMRPYYQDLDALPYFDWSVFDNRQFLKPYDGKVYIGGDHMIYWGCPNQCTYCINNSYRRLYGSKAGRFLRCYSVNRIIEELKYLVDKWGIQFFKFHDEDFCLKPLEYFKNLAQRYKEEIGIPFTIMANARNVNREKVELLKKMNCVSATLGIETGNQKLRKEVLKRIETKEQIIAATKMLNDAGIRTSAFNMLAIPFENRQTVFETIELNREADVRYPNAGFFFPLENTELRETAINNGFFDESADAVFQNDKPALTFTDITTEELIALRERFVLYIKLPLSFRKYIERSEKNDAVGIRLTKELYRIYDECVFANDSMYDDKGKHDRYFEQLDHIYRGNNE